MATFRSARQKSSFNERGQVVVEYVLLLVIGVMISFMITTTMVSRDPNSPGFLIRKWHDILKVIGADAADDVNSP